MGIDRSPAGAVDVHAVSSPKAVVKAPYLITVIASSTPTGLIGFEDRRQHAESGSSSRRCHRLKGLGSCEPTAARTLNMKDGQGANSAPHGRMQLSYPQPLGFQPSIRTLRLRPAPCASPRPIPFHDPFPGTKPVTTIGP